MDGLSSIQSLEALSKLLSQGRDDEEDEQPASSTASLGPGHIGPAKCETNVPPVVSKNSKDIWSEEEVPEGSELDDTWDPRQQPEYEILFKQKVTTEDVFLGMSRKDPSSACCECMLIKIKLPDTKIADVFLDVKEKFLDLRSPKFKLGLHLPHPVDSKTGKARFISEAHTLEVTLTMQREMDFINFA
ncbi:protein PIH1D3 [Polyodon spathula]|uniref:protein PIH1D3 n=1 Tax=Polyodon spathula TaxID=7913 RepID=UPI001B7E9E02|nr:protein PIH1D3 [Polyodon spathula]